MISTTHRCVMWLVVMLLLVSGCQFLVDIDRSLIPDAGMQDAGGDPSPDASAGN